MSKRYYKPLAEKPVIPEGASPLPTDHPIAVYYRQSSDAQIGNISTTIQTVDMVAYLKQRGWNEENIHMIDMDAGVSGTKKIDERPGMRLLFDLIVKGEISAVACQDEDRLFRDVTQIQVNIFIEACRAAQVLVLTPSMVYDFANELTGAYHARQFRFKCEMAAEYLNSVIRGRLHRARDRMLMDGRWAGGSVPPGLMVDMRKTLPDGSKNEHWRHYAPFEQYADVVREYFRLFLAHGGNIRSTIMDIHEHGPYYPDPAICLPPEGFKVVWRMQRYGNGYCPGRTAFLELLTNATYIGHWMVNDTIVRWNNHEPIVPIDDFTQAFNYLSPLTLDGRSNPDFRPAYQHSRPSLEKDRLVERPLLVGLMVTNVEGTWRNVATRWINHLGRYSYQVGRARIGKEYIWSKAANWVDEAVVAQLLKRLSKTFNSAKWEESLLPFTETYTQERKQKMAQREALERVMQNQIASLDVVTNRDMIQGAQERYEAAQAEHQRLTADIAAADDELRRIRILRELKENYAPAIDNWESMSRDEKRVTLPSVH